MIQHLFTAVSLIAASGNFWKVKCKRVSLKSSPPAYQVDFSKINIRSIQPRMLHLLCVIFPLQENGFSLLVSKLPNRGNESGHLIERHVLGVEFLDL